MSFGLWPSSPQPSQDCQRCDVGNIASCHMLNLDSAMMNTCTRLRKSKKLFDQNINTYPNIFQRQTLHFTGPHTSSYFGLDTILCVSVESLCYNNSRFPGNPARNHFHTLDVCIYTSVTVWRPASCHWIEKCIAAFDLFPEGFDGWVMFFLSPNEISCSET